MVSADSGNTMESFITVAGECMVSNKIRDFSHVKFRKEEDIGSARLYNLLYTGQFIVHAPGIAGIDR